MCISSNLLQEVACVYGTPTASILLTPPPSPRHPLANACVPPLPPRHCLHPPPPHPPPHPTPRAALATASIPPFSPPLPVCPSPPTPPPPPASIPSPPRPPGLGSPHPLPLVAALPMSLALHIDNYLTPNFLFTSTRSYRPSMVHAATACATAL